MTYPYDGIRSSMEYYNNYIDYLKEQIKKLEKENEELKKKPRYKIKIKKRIK